jgi:hypothetical protein
MVTRFARMRDFVRLCGHTAMEARLPARIIREGGLKAYYIRDFELVLLDDGEFEYVDPFWNWLFCRMSPDELAARLSGTSLRVGKGG